MKTSIVILLLVLFLWACEKADKFSPDKSDTNTETAQLTKDHEMASAVKRGEYLVNIAGCHDCHSPKIMTEFGPEHDESRLLSGHPADMKIAAYDPDILKNYALFNYDFTAAVGPWGVSFSANLTSDDTGIGLWKEEQFMRALQKGKFKGLENGRDLLPPMPWQNFAKLSEEDIKAIFAYLKSTKPIRNIVPSAIPPTAISMN